MIAKSVNAFWEAYGHLVRSPPATNTDPRLDPVSGKADAPPLAHAATLDNRVGVAARFADESPVGARRGGGGGRRGGWARAGDGPSVNRRRSAGRGRG
jgi:hypothetical protein